MDMPKLPPDASPYFRLIAGIAYGQAQGARLERIATKAFMGECLCAEPYGFGFACPMHHGCPGCGEGGWQG